MGLGTILALGFGAWMLFGQKKKGVAEGVAPQSLPPANGNGTPPGPLAPAIPDELAPGAPDHWSATPTEIQAAQARITDFGQSLAPAIIEELIMGGTLPPDAFDAFGDPGLMRPIRLMPGVYAVPNSLIEMLSPELAPPIDPFEGGEWF
jgi:hypothetical protein